MVSNSRTFLRKLGSIRDHEYDSCSNGPSWESMRFQGWRLRPSKTRCRLGRKEQSDRIMRDGGILSRSERVAGGGFDVSRTG